MGVVLLLGAGGAAAYLVTLAATFDTGTARLGTAFPEESTRPSPAPATQGKAAQNILLLGSDTRGSVGGNLDNVSGQRADTIMVVHIPADRSGVYVMSLMRDSWVDIPGRGQAKVNAALSFGGVPLMVQTVESLIGARIDHVAVIDFEGFRGLTDALGGVQVDNAEGFTAGGRRFDPGTIRLDGESALTFVRERYAFADGDYQRVRNQQAYLRGLLGGILNSDTLLNPARVSGVVGSIAPYLTVDDQLNSAYLAGLALDMPLLRPADIVFFTAPTTGTGTSSDGQSIVNLDAARFEDLRQAFANDELDTFPTG